MQKQKKHASFSVFSLLSPSTPPPPPQWNHNITFPRAGALFHRGLHALPQPKPDTTVSTQHTELCLHFTPASLGKTPSHCRICPQGKAAMGCASFPTSSQGNAWTYNVFRFLSPRKAPGWISLILLKRRSLWRHEKWIIYREIRQCHWFCVISKHSVSKQQ